MKPEAGKNFSGQFGSAKNDLTASCLDIQAAIESQKARRYLHRIIGSRGFRKCESYNLQYFPNPTLTNSTKLLL